MERARPPEDISAEEFFTRWIVEAVATDPERRRRLQRTEATVVFDLEGEAGGVFSVRIDRGLVRGSAGDSQDHDLRVEVDVATWRALNAGVLTAPEALLKRRVKLRGDFVLGLKLHLILA